MSIPGAGNPLLLGGAGGYKIERSLRFNSADSAYLSRTPASAGNRKTWTFSFWCKRTSFPAGITYVLGAFPTASIEFLIGFTSNQQFYIQDFPGSTALDVTSAAVFRDPSAWYHFVVSVDTTQATASNRVRLYANGSQITSFATATYPTQNHDVNIWDTSQATAIGARGRTFTNPANYYLADIHFIDGQALTPSSFGETDINGVWQPKAYSGGSYGTNGFKLAFADNSAATATTLGKDTSGNGNNWTPNNLSVTAGAGNDSLTDSPTNYGTDTGAGGEVRGNYATLNPLASTITPFNGNLSVNVLYSAEFARGSIGINASKHYFEVLVETATTGHNIGVTTTSSGSLSDYWLYHYNGNIYTPSTTITPGLGVLSQGTIIGVAVDSTAGTIAFYKNNVLAHTFAGLSTSVTYFPLLAGTNSGTYTTLQANFGQRPFAYTAPSGFKALCTQNLPAPTITRPSTVMDVALWTGNGSARSITGLGFNPDLVWIKGRSGATDHALYDSVRGATLDLVSNSTAAETTQTQGLTAFNSDGFSLGTLAKVNTNAATYAGWAFDAGSSTVTNTAGTITSQVRANASAGFSVVSYNLQATGSKTVGHGLGVAPSLIIAIPRSVVHNTFVYHSSVGATAFLYLNTTDASSTNSTVWDNTSPTSSVFTLGSGWTSGTYGTAQIAYCFAPVAGYSAFGSYTGNGSADGPFVYTGFRPSYLLIKQSSASGQGWEVRDYAREPYNDANRTILRPNAADAEVTDAFPIDFLSNGFKLRSIGTGSNENTQTYIYAAFAENPFQYARAR